MKRMELSETHMHPLIAHIHHVLHSVYYTQDTHIHYETVKHNSYQVYFTGST